ncbi:3-ketodihydrosphingosine reductase [Rhipicephalus sanguineus]|uniref:3-ketodihydrosphingosine reductase n=1 Tax=Rhipicephalus sanguineus TaxID=34632 RepID=UPI0018941DDC|nr:3-ketodihydrosphingosine reductase [Rhipicephalus sanguineus]XP_049272738.1 3-ketodihydrosphingosine reductase [Rhipicephalus sanguineus]
MAQPSSLLSTPWQYYVPLLLASPVALLVVSKLWRRYQARNACLRHRHFIITGGSSGIGRALARAAVQRGANVTLIARNLDRLEEAKIELLEKTSSPEQAVHTLSADLTKGEAGEAVLARGIEEAEQVCGPVDYLVNCAGSAISLRFDETPLVEFQHMMEVNYLSAVHTTMAVLPGMKQRGSGSITFVSSIAGLMGLYGYTAYSPSKFALVGLAQSLRMEVKHRGIQVTVAFPPDTDTPGFAEEERTKPTETKLISAMAGLYSADVVATSLLQDILEGNTTSALGLDGHITVALCAGMMPPSSLLEAVVQALTMGILRVIGCLYVWHFYRLVARCAANREGSKKGS